MKNLFLLFFCLLGTPLCAAAELPPVSAQIYDRYGVPMRSFLSDNQTYFRPVSLDDISPWMVLSAVSLEDKRFFSHSGVDWASVARAAWSNAAAWEVVSGASTITQQLVRSKEPHAKTLWGKAAEALAALRLETQSGKDEILQDYFNRLEFGNLTQGVEAAANFYFNTSAAQLSLSQAAFLAGMIKSPSKYNPLKNFPGALKRRDLVLKSMLHNGFITPELYQLAKEETVQLSALSRPFSAPHFSRFVYNQLPLDIAAVHSTIDKDVQVYAEEIVRQSVKKLADNNVTNAAVVVLDNATGAVLAYVGSADFYNIKNSGEIDGVRAKRQPGSALKPFVYALGLQRGMTAADLIADEDTFFEGGFRPRNYDETFHGPVALREALACSYNIPVVKVAEAVGTGKILNLLHALGIASLQKEADFYGLGLALGSGEVSLLELANAYAALSRGGVYRPVVLANQPRLENGAGVRRVMAEETAYIITHILSDNSARAAAFGLNSPLSLPFELAAKTGTSKDYKDNFTIGYTPRWTVAVWAGNFDASPMEKVSGVSGAAPIMHDIALYLQQKYPSGPVSRPLGVVSAPVCVDSGLAAGPDCPHTREEVFAAGTEPKTVCSGRHGAVAAEELAITFPQPGDVFKRDPALPFASQQLKFTVSSAGTKGFVWKLNEKKLAGEGNEIWWKIEPGKYTLTCEKGTKKAQTSFEVL